MKLRDILCKYHTYLKCKRITKTKTWRHYIFKWYQTNMCERALLPPHDARSQNAINSLSLGQNWTIDRLFEFRRRTHFQIRISFKTNFPQKSRDQFAWSVHIFLFCSIMFQTSRRKKEVTKIFETTYSLSFGHYQHNSWYDLIN